MNGLLAKLLALANRPGTEAEGAAARAHAERVAAREGLVVTESSISGELISLDALHGDLLEALQRIAEGHEHGRKLNEGGS